MLEVEQLSVSYGAHPALQDAELTVASGEIVVILGANGAGKSTLLRAVSGICEGQVQGRVTLRGETLIGLDSDAIVERGVALVPEGRGIFGDLSVRENLLLGAYSQRARSDEAANLERVLQLFPKLRERQRQIARTMSGGEQQMVAIGRAMMSAPQILMLDEPSLGLSPLLCKELFASLTEVKNSGIGILLVEQNARQSLAIADRGYLLENTRITHADSAEKLATDPAVQQAYLGAGSKVVKTTVSAVSDVADAAPDSVVASSHFEPRATPRRTADQQVGFSIDGLVADAAQQSAKVRHSPAAGSGAAMPPASGQLSGGESAARLDAVIHDIEQAAARARRAPPPATAQRQPSRSVGTTASRAVNPEDQPPIVIEVYKRPRVEVYRRRPDGRHARD